MITKSELKEIKRLEQQLSILRSLKNGFSSRERKSRIGLIGIASNHIVKNEDAGMFDHNLNDLANELTNIAEAEISKRIHLTEMELAKRVVDDKQ